MMLTILCEILVTPHPVQGLLRSPLVPAGRLCQTDDGPAMAVCVVECDGDQAAMLRADGRCVVLAAGDEATALGGVDYAKALAWLGGKGVPAKDLQAAFGPPGGGRTKGERIDLLKTWLRQQAAAHSAEAIRAEGGR